MFYGTVAMPYPEKSVVPKIHAFTVASTAGADYVFRGLTLSSRIRHEFGILVRPGQKTLRPRPDTGDRSLNS